MHRLATIVVGVCVATEARGEDRVELQLPDLALLETVFHLDRYQERDSRSRSELRGSLGVGAGNDGAEISATEAIGLRSERGLGAIRSEFATSGLGILRGRHRGLLEVRDEPLGAVLALHGGLDYGQALGLAPASLGSGRRTTADGALDGAIRLGKDKGDFVWVGELHGDAGATYWADAPVDHASRRALGLGLGQQSFDGEIPRGTIDVLRGRVSDVTIQRPLLAAGASSLDSHVRIVELGVGTNELTLHVDREVLAVIAVDLGWSWLESDRAGASSSTSAFRMRLGTAIETRDERDRGPRRIGVGLSRTPTYSPDGQLASEWRFELDLGRETERWIVAGRGGISWLTPLDAAARPTSLRYASQLEAFLKATAGIEVGAYHAAAFEPPIAGDPWTTPRRWRIETGVLVRLRR